MTSLLCFAFVAAVVETDGRLVLDTRLTDRLGRLYPDRGGDFVVHAGSVGAPVLAAVAAVVLLAASRIRLAIFWIVAVGGVLALDPLLKAAFERPALNGRSGDYSFPSGSAMLAMALVVALWLLNRRRLVVALLGVVLVVLHGAALVATRWHYPSDVLGGWLLALAWVIAAWVALSARAQDGV